MVFTDFYIEGKYIFFFIFSRHLIKKKYINWCVCGWVYVRTQVSLGLKQH